jgi:CubicO group peptidase (beta-lactamase class C family)
MMRFALAAVALLATSAAGAPQSVGLHQAVEQLASQGKFSGAIVIRGPAGVRFSRGYGFADPFTGRAFTPDTPVDSGSLAKPVTAAAVLLLARDGKIDLAAPAIRFLPELGHREITIRQLLSHSAGLQLDETAQGLAGKSNLQLVKEASSRPLLFLPGGTFTYCNLCTIALAQIVERISGRHYLDFARRRLAFPAEVGIRPARLADWRDRAIGYRRTSKGGLERADSYEGEIFYGSANLSISAAQLAEWGSRWWRLPLSSLRRRATTPAKIGGNPSGLTLGNWYCTTSERQCHYLGHHEGFHHMLYWDAERRISVAMVSNDTLAPGLQQRLQRALVAFAQGRAVDGRRELSELLADEPVSTGAYKFPTGERVVVASAGRRVSIERRGIIYPAYLIGTGIRYVPGLDVYLAGAPGGGLRWLSLYEDFTAVPLKRTAVTND